MNTIHIKLDLCKNVFSCSHCLNGLMKQSKGFLDSLDKNKIKQILGSTSSRRPQHFVCITLLNFYQHFILTAVAKGRRRKLYSRAVSRRLLNHLTPYLLCPQDTRADTLPASDWLLSQIKPSDWSDECC